MRILTINITIDMLLDGYLELVCIDSEGKESSQGKWCSPNLNYRDNLSKYDIWKQYYPVVKQTELKFEFTLQDDIVSIDVDKSIISLGYTGFRADWVGPGRMFKYNLSHYISGPITVTENNFS